MKMILITIIVFTLLSCKNSNNPLCADAVYIKETPICIAEPNELKEVSNDQSFSTFVNQFVSADNNIIAFYVDNETEPNSLDSNKNYASIYTNKNMEKDLSKSQFNQMSKTMGSYLNKPSNINSILKDLNTNYFDNITLGKPIVIDNYASNDNTNTYILLGKTMDNSGEIITLTTLNLIYIKEKMILSNYVIEYENRSSIEELKLKNNNFISSLFKSNIKE